MMFSNVGASRANSAQHKTGQVNRLQHERKIEDVLREKLRESQLVTLAFCLRVQHGTG